MSELSLAIEEVLAAVILSNENGAIFVPTETLESDMSGLAIAIDRDEQRDGIVLSIVNKEDIEYDDED